MKIIITAAGLGSRFAKEGINIPKYLIKARGKTLLEHSISTLSNFYNNEFIFIFRDIKNQNEIENIINNLKNNEGHKIKNYHILSIDKLTKGQAETVLLANSFFDNNDESILIYNIDTCVSDAQNHILKSDIENDCDGLIYTVKANGSHWSFAKTKSDSNEVIEVSEKVKISDNASIGLYYFKSFNEFKDVLVKNKIEIIKQFKELYIMPLYKYLIDKNKKIIIKNIPLDNFIPLGTPDEVYAFDNDYWKEFKKNV